MMARHHYRAARDAGARATLFFLGVLLIAIIGAAYVTDGFKKYPDWTHFREWSAMGARP